MRGLTLSLDFYHIDLRAVTITLRPQFLINHEDEFPGQVIRGPSTGPDDPFGPGIDLAASSIEKHRTNAGAPGSENVLLFGIADRDRVCRAHADGRKRMGKESRVGFPETDIA